MQTTTSTGTDSSPVERARLTLEGLQSRVVTRVRHRGLYRMTVAQSLPFLRLSAAVRDEEGRAAHIESVTVEVDGDTPSLVLELVYEDEEPVRVAMPAAEMGMVAAKKKRRDPTVPYEIPKARARRDATVPYATERATVKPPRDVIVPDAPVAIDIAAPPASLWARVVWWLFGWAGATS